MSTPRMTEQELQEAHRRVRLSRAAKGRVRMRGADGEAVTPVIRSTDSNRREPCIRALQAGSTPASSPSFIVHGVAIGKPRMTQRDKWKQRPVVLRYRAWCDLVRFAAGRTEKITLTYGIHLSAVFYLPCPVSWSQAERDRLMGTPHVGKPDVDNLLKGLMDALFVNDALVWSIEAKKYWDNRLGPHVVVRMGDGQP